jgi:CRISPR-associated protein Cas2
MMMLISYDVSTESDRGKRRLRRVSRACLDYGQRVQFSVFECEPNPAQWAILRANPTLFAHWPLCHGNGRTSGAV